MDPTALAAQLSGLTTGLTAERQLNSLYLASAAIMVLDWLLMLDLEVRHIWESRWNGTKALYLVARYLPFIDLPVLIYHQFAHSPSLTVCNVTYKYQAWVFVVGSAVSELRTWAVWNKDGRLTFVLFGTLALTTAAEFYLVAKFLQSSSHEISPLPKLIGCYITSSNPNLAICFAIFMGFDGCILLLMIIRGVAAFKSGGNSRLLRVVYGDGIIYYVYIFGLSLVNVVIIYKLSSQYTTLLAM
ncbi:hypothetical protein NP233_g12885 [Leucocoprinus birnbaumii]|uniref:DUF6533 domain-containing protein n=1 Tax=Leucocoprinus birnbaumii TaxID=56174 RepID=A0AAD5VEY3_9AGAR|nr:hypothetical protein NP233_g12885 [Leucocoprinus birnbaumii]